MDRLFVTLWPSTDTVAELGALPRPDEPDVRWSRPENWHVTLRFLGDAPVDEVGARLAAATFPVATARLGPAVERLGSGLLIVPVAGVDAVAAAVHGATEGLGEPSNGPFRGHLTLARLKRGARSSVLGTPFRAAFEAREVALVRSELHPTGAVYSTLATYPTQSIA